MICGKISVLRLTTPSCCKYLAGTTSLLRGMGEGLVDSIGKTCFFFIITWSKLFLVRIYRHRKDEFLHEIFTLCTVDNRS